MLDLTLWTEPACRAVVAARLHAPTAEELLLRHLRIRTASHPDFGAYAMDHDGGDPIASFRVAAAPAALAAYERRGWLVDPSGGPDRR